MAFGISFGSKKQSSESLSNVNRDTTLSGSQTTSGTQAQSQSGTTSSTGMSSTTQTGGTTSSQKTTGTETGRQTGTSTTLSADIQAGLSDKIKSILAGGVTDSALASLSNAISGRVDSFNPDAAVAGIVAGARNRGEQTLQEQNSAFAARAGGTATTNSMAALMAQRGRNDLEASIAGIQGDAMMKAQQVANQNLTSAAGAQGQVADIATQLAGTLKGATTTSDMTSLTSQIQSLLGDQATKSASSTAQQQQEQTTMTQLLTQLSQVLSNQKESVVGTESTTSKGKTSGGGLSLGF